jgi:hypothetical protein
MSLAQLAPRCRPRQLTDGPVQAHDAVPRSFTHCGESIVGMRGARRSSVKRFRRSARRTLTGSRRAVPHIYARWVNKQRVARQGSLTSMQHNATTAH